jgi:hypothetical protein
MTNHKPAHPLSAEPDPHDNEPCLKCGRWIRLGPEARPNENPRRCGECNFDLYEFARLRDQDLWTGQPPRERYRPARTWPPSNERQR